MFLNAERSSKSPRPDTDLDHNPRTTPDIRETLKIPYTSPPPLQSQGEGRIKARGQSQGGERRRGGDATSRGGSSSTRSGAVPRRPCLLARRHPSQAEQDIVQWHAVAAVPPPPLHGRAEPQPTGRDPAVAPTRHCGMSVIRNLPPLPPLTGRARVVLAPGWDVLATCWRRAGAYKGMLTAPRQTQARGRHETRDPRAAGGASAFEKRCTTPGHRDKKKSGPAGGLIPKKRRPCPGLKLSEHIGAGHVEHESPASYTALTQFTRCR